MPDDPIQLTAIEVEVIDDQVAIPHGMKPIHLHEYLSGRKWIAHVGGWTAQREYEQNLFDVYLLNEAQSFILTMRDGSTGETTQEWYHSFMPSTHEITKGSSWATVQA